MFKLATLTVLLATTVSGDLLELQDETGEIMLFSSAEKGFNSFEEMNGNLDDLECYLQSVYFGECKNFLTKQIRQFHDITEPIIVGYFINEVYSVEDLNIFKQTYKYDNKQNEYNYVDIFGISLELGSQLYYKINSILKQRRYRQYPNDFIDFTDKYKKNKKIVMFEVDTVDNALSLSKNVTQYISETTPSKNLISLIAPAKVEYSEYSIGRRLLIDYNYSVCNTSNGDYCIDYYCNRSSWDTQAYSDSCINEYDLFMLVLFIFLFLPFCCVGCCCLDGITTPLRFPSRVLPVGKEF